MESRPLVSVRRRISRHGLSCSSAFGWAVFGLTIVLCCAPSSSRGQSIWELTPYRVRLQVTTDPVMNAEGLPQQQLARQLVNRCDAVIGATWDVEIVEADATAQQSAADWLNIAPHVPVTEDIPEGADELFDKLFIIQVNKDTLGYHIQCREFDARTRTWSPTIERTTVQPALLVETTFDAMLTAFAPLGKIEEAEKKSAEIRLLGGALPRADESWHLIQPGDLLRPLMRFNERDGSPKKILPIDWTYLLVDSLEDSMAQCQIHSGLRSPLSGRTRGRVERLALLVQPQGGTTNLQLVARGDREQPLEGYEVYAHPADSKTTTLLGQSDVYGNVHIPSGEHPLRILLVRHGGDFLARLPVVPGLIPDTVAEIPNDDERLQVVGIITGIQESLVDLVVRREMLMLQLRAAIESRDFDQADQLVQRLRSVRLEEDKFRVYLRQREQAIVSSDPVVQRRIDKMFGDTSNLMANYFDPRPMLELEAQLAQARQAPEPTPEEVPAVDEAPPESQEIPPEPASASINGPNDLSEDEIAQAPRE